MPNPAPVAFRSAQMLMNDAVESVTKAHTGSVTHFLANKASSTLTMMTTEQRVSTGIGLGLAAGVGIAGIVVTGGLAIPLLLALGGTGYLVTKAIEEFGADYRRNNRNWLQRFPNASPADGALLTIEASDALRRAIDHYRMMSAIGREVEAHTGVDYASCEDAINHAKAVARFIHHSDKVRNYTLPVLDVLIFYMKQYIEVKTTWDAWEPKFNLALQAWFENHGGDSCCAGKPEPCVCYAPFNGLTLSRGAGTRPAKRITGATGVIPSTYPEIGAAPGHPDAVEIADILGGMETARLKIVSEMHKSSTKTWNYSAERPKTASVAPPVATPGAPHPSVAALMHKKRIDHLIDAVWKQVDRPGYFSRGTRRISHWYTRHTTSEKVGQVFSEGAALGSIFMPFVKGAHVSDLAKSLISGSTSATVLISDKLGLSALKAMDGKPLQCSMVNPAVLDAKVTEEIRAHGANVQTMFPKLMLHFKKAAEALKLLQAMPTTINSCNDAMSLATKAAELLTQMEKVSRYAGPCLGVTDLLTAACFDWAEREANIWYEMESHMGEFLRDDAVHEVCRSDSKKCYGARHSRVGTNILGRGGKWQMVTNEAHNPIT
ncbi:MAG: hypothetical protein V4505_12725 [Pseudomonadota bacterium]